MDVLTDCEDVVGEYKSSCTGWGYDKSFDGMAQDLHDAVEDLGLAVNTAHYADQQQQQHQLRTGQRTFGSSSQIGHVQAHAARAGRAHMGRVEDPLAGLRTAVNRLLND